jgi:alkylation response protein AidB-like acyl-CoA dehydrogenase
MDFELSEEQRLLRDSVGRLLADHYTFDKRRAYHSEPEGWSRALWTQYAELGLLGLPFGEQYGGFGGGPIEVMLVMEAFGRVLALEPYLATVVLGATALRLAGTEAQKSALLPQIAEGKLILAFAHGERQARYDLSDVLTTAKPKAGGWVLDGAKSVVLHGDCAQLLVVSARTGGERDDPDGITLFLVDAAANGVARRSYPMRDGTRAAEISLSDVEVSNDALIGEVGAGFPVIERVVEAGIAATAAEAVGAMEAMQALTLEYLKTRQQIRPADRAEPGTTASRDGNDDGARAGAQYGDVGGNDGRRARRGRARSQHFDGESRRWTSEQIRLAERDPIAWRHRHDRGIRGRPLFSPLHGHRAPVRRRRPSPVAAGG